MRPLAGVLVAAATVAIGAPTASAQDVPQPEAPPDWLLGQVTPIDRGVTPWKLQPQEHRAASKTCGVATMGVNGNHAGKPMYGSGDHAEHDKNTAGDSVKFDLVSIGHSVHTRFTIRLGHARRICYLYAGDSHGAFGSYVDPRTARRLDRRTFEFVDPRPIWDYPPTDPPVPDSAGLKGFVFSLAVRATSCAAGTFGENRRICRLTGYPEAR